MLRLQFSLKMAIILMLLAGLFVGAGVWYYQRSKLASVRIVNKSGNSVLIRIKLAIRSDESEHEMKVWEQYLDPLQERRCALKADDRQYWIESCSKDSGNSELFGFWTKPGKREELEIAADGKVIRRSE